jgi:hypothetical protein
MLGGWKFSPIFTAQSGSPLEVNIGNDCQSFGEVNCSSGSTNENAIMLSPYKGGNSAHYDVTGSNGVGTSTKTQVNLFADPAAVYALFRPPLVGLDNQTGGQGILRGMPTFNLDMSVGKEFKITERVNAKFIATFTNVLNHSQLRRPEFGHYRPTDLRRDHHSTQHAKADGVRSPHRVLASNRHLRRISRCASGVVSCCVRLPAMGLFPPALIFVLEFKRERDETGGSRFYGNRD